MMTVRVQLFARARELAGKASVELVLPEDASVGELRRQLAAVQPALESLLEHSAIAVDQEFAQDGHRLPPQAEIAVIPPVSGGSQAGA